MDGVKYEIEQHGDSFVLFSLVQTPLGRVVKKFVRKAQTAGELAATIRRLQNAN
jgi:ribosomal protein L34E